MRAYFLVGPTASRKTEVAEWIAEREGFDILSADSMLVYKGMDIGTAKPDPATRARIRYYGLDLATPDHAFSVAEYRKSALDALAECLKAGRNAMVVGGSGLYLKCLTHGLAQLPGPHANARSTWQSLLETHGINALQEALRQKNPTLYSSLADISNPRRLIRALELADAGVPELPRSWKAAAPDGRQAGPIPGPLPDRESHRKAIEARVKNMYDRGFADEVRNLLAKYDALSAMAMQAIGYRECILCLQGRLTLEQAIVQTAKRTRQLAKRQMTWFRHQLDVHWIEISGRDDTQLIAQCVLEHWRKYGPAEVAP